MIAEIGPKKIFNAKILSDLNLNGYTPVKQFLDNANVRNIDEERFSFMSYCMHQ